MSGGTRSRRISPDRLENDPVAMEKVPQSCFAHKGAKSSGMGIDRLVLNLSRIGETHCCGTGGVGGWHPLYFICIYYISREGDISVCQCQTSRT